MLVGSGSQLESSRRLRCCAMKYQVQDVLCVAPEQERCCSLEDRNHRDHTEARALFRNVRSTCINDTDYQDCTNVQRQDWRDGCVLLLEQRSLPLISSEQCLDHCGSPVTHESTARRFAPLGATVTVTLTSSRRHGVLGRTRE